MDEFEARQILRQRNMERDITDARSCAQIVSDLKLLPEVEPVIEPIGEDAVE